MASSTVSSLYQFLYKHVNDVLLCDLRTDIMSLEIGIFQLNYTLMGPLSYVAYC